MAVQEILEPTCLRILSVGDDLQNQPKKSGETEDTHDYKWWVPISFDFEGGKFNQTRNSHWLKPDQDKLTIQLPEGNIKILRFLMNKISWKLKKRLLIFSL